jgi:hypothetical protein
MRTPAKMVYDLLVASRATLGLGSALSGENWAIYRDHIPTDPALVVAVFSTPAAAIDVPLDLTHSYVEAVHVQIQVRGRSRDEAEAKAIVIRDFLTTTSHRSEETSGGKVVRWQAIRPAGGSFAPMDAKALHVAIQNVQVVRSVEKE